MAQNPVPNLIFREGCPDCGSREVQLPERLPAVGDDFDWLLRDYDGFRIFMLEELAARFPERRRWTPADMEVVLVETLSGVLDQLSDMLDRIHTEAYLQDARRPESVRRLLAMIGYDAVALAHAAAGIPDGTPSAGETSDETRARLKDFHTALQLFLDDYRSIVETELTPLQQNHLVAFIRDPDGASTPALDAVQHFLDNAPLFIRRARQHALHRYWTRHPAAMEDARAAGPRSIHTQKRMVTQDDYAERMEDHPLVLRAHAASQWGGSWTTFQVALILSNNMPLDEPLTVAAAGGTASLAALQQAVDAFNRGRGLEPPDWSADPSPRTILRPFLDAYRMAGQEVFLRDAEPVGIQIAISVRIAGNYFQSEVRRAVLDALGSGLGGFFEPGRLKFGEDLHASDIIETVMALDGVAAVCLNRFKRMDKRYADQSDSGRIGLDGIEIAVCDNDPAKPERGTLRVVAQGGQRG